MTQLLLAERNERIAIQCARWHRVQLPLSSDWITSHSAQSTRELVILELVDADGVIGWGECCATEAPTYVEEYLNGELIALTRRLLPAVLDKPVCLADLDTRIDGRHNRFARAALEGALIDLLLRRQGRCLADAFGVLDRRAPAGIALGRYASHDKLLEEIQSWVDRGVHRVKCKVGREDATPTVSAVRSRFPNLTIGIDANGEFTTDDLATLQALDAFDLAFIEQPLISAASHQAIAEVTEALRTPVCLDESIRTPGDVVAAKALGIGMINLKPARVGGILCALAVLDAACEADIGVWIGGMFESGIGRSVNIAMSCLEGVTMPGDLVGSDRYFPHDLVSPAPRLHEGTLRPLSAPGLGFTIDRDALEAFRVEYGELSPNRT